MVQTISMGAVSVLMAVAALVEDTPKPFPPVDVMTGDDSYTERPSIELEQNYQSWNAAWQRYKGVTPIGNTNGAAFPSAEHAPPVDFDHNNVLVVFGGLASVSAYQVEDSFVQKRKVHVRLQEIPLAPGAANLTGIKANPYAFIILPRSRYAMDVEFPSADQNGNTVWRSVASFPAPSGATGN